MNKINLKKMMIMRILKIWDKKKKTSKKINNKILIIKKWRLSDFLINFRLFLFKYSKKISED
jgi:hypothetical protein